MTPFIGLLTVIAVVSIVGILSARAVGLKSEPRRTIGYGFQSGGTFQNAGSAGLNKDRMAEGSSNQNELSSPGGEQLDPAKISGR